MSMNTTLTSNSWHSKYVWFIRLLIQILRFRKILINNSNNSNHSSKFTVLVVAALTQKRPRQQAKQTHNLLLGVAYVFFWESYLFCDSNKMSIHGELKSTTSLLSMSIVLLSMSMMSASNFEYELYEYECV